MTQEPLIVDIRGINPVPWQPSRPGGRGNKQFFKPAELAMYQDSLAAALQALDTRKWEGPMSLRLYLWRKLEAGTRTHSGRRHRAHQADATNMQKATEDACQGALFANDREVVDVHTMIMEQSPECEPRIIIEIMEPKPWLPPTTGIVGGWEMDQSDDVAQRIDPGVEF